MYYLSIITIIIVVELVGPTINRYN